MTVQQLIRYNFSKHDGNLSGYSVDLYYTNIFNKDYFDTFCGLFYLDTHKQWNFKTLTQRDLFLDSVARSVAIPTAIISPSNISGSCSWVEVE